MHTGIAHPAVRIPLHCKSELKNAIHTTTVGIHTTTVGISESVTECEISSVFLYVKPVRQRRDSFDCEFGSVNLRMISWWQRREKDVTNRKS